MVSKATLMTRQFFALWVIFTRLKEMLRAASIMEKMLCWVMILTAMYYLYLIGIL